MKMPKWIGLAVLPFALSSCFIVVVDNSKQAANLRAQTTFCASGHGAGPSKNNTTVDYKFDVVGAPLTYQVFWGPSNKEPVQGAADVFGPYERTVTAGKTVEAGYLLVSDLLDSFSVAPSALTPQIVPAVWVRVKKTDGTFGPFLKSADLKPSSTDATCDPTDQALL